MTEQSDTIRVKLEPGIKMESNLPSTTRLTSFRMRDWTLGGNTKKKQSSKVYTPNVNVQRNKKDETTTTKVSVNVPARSKDGDRERGRGRGGIGKGRGRGEKANLIQSVGVFSDGIYTPSVKRSDSSSRSGSYRDKTDIGKYMEKPKVNLNKIASEEKDEKKLKELLHDFIDDGPESDEKIDFLELPRIVNKTEIVTDDEIEQKPTISESGKVISIKKENKHFANRLTIPQLIENNTNSFTLIQFPATFQNLNCSSEELRSTRPSNSNTQNESTTKTKEKAEYSLLNNLNSGHIGKLEILKSGRVRMRLGEISFFVNASLQQKYQQDLIATKLDSISLNGDFINLGQVNSTLCCLPDVESMIKNL